MNLFYHRTEIKEREIKRIYTHVPYEQEKWRPGQNLPALQGFVVGYKQKAGSTTAGVGKTANFLYPNIEYSCTSGMSFLCTDSAGRSRRISMVPIIQSFAQLQKNYGKEGSAIIIDNCQNILFWGFAPNSESADILSKALGNKTVMSGSISRGKNDSSQSLQMIQRPLMTPDELKTLPKGHFILAKTGCCPKRTTLKLFLKWGIVFEKPYEVEKRSARKVAYADRFELEQEILQRGCAYEADFDEVSEFPNDAATGGALHTPVQQHQDMIQKPPLRTD